MGVGDLPDDCVSVLGLCLCSPPTVLEIHDADFSWSDIAPPVLTPGSTGDEGSELRLGLRGSQGQLLDQAQEDGPRWSTFPLEATVCL